MSDIDPFVIEDQPRLERRAVCPAAGAGTNAKHRLPDGLILRRSVRDSEQPEPRRVSVSPLLDTGQDRSVLDHGIGRGTVQKTRRTDPSRFAGAILDMSRHDVGGQGSDGNLGRRRLSAKHHRRDAFLGRAAGHQIHRLPSPRHSQCQTREHILLAGCSCNQAQDMDPTRLPNAIHAAGALLEPQRHPRELEADNEPAAMVQVEPFGAGIGGEEQRAGAAGELRQDLRAFPSAQAAVQLERLR